MATDKELERLEEEERRAAKAYEKERRARRARLEARRKTRQKHIMRLGTMVIAGAALIIFLIIAAVFALGNPVRKVLRVEAGSAMPTARDFLKNAGSKKEVTLLTDISGLTTAHVSETEVTLQVGNKERHSTLIIADTTPPVAEASPMSVSAGMVVLPEDLIKNAEDATTLTYEFAEEPDCTTLGTKEATVLITDEGGNQISVTTEVSVVNDTEAPLISGVGPLTTLQGEAVDYMSGVQVSDNIDRRVEVKADTSTVDLNKPGVYSIIYRSVDQAGNATEVQTTLSVEEKADDYVDLETIYQLADRALAEIVTEDMTPDQKARAIYTYTRNSIWYYDGFHGDSWTASAKMGFEDKAGDCYVYAAMGRALLERSGFSCIMVDRNDPADPERNGYRWLLVDCGQGWYHFDTTARRDGTEFFMWTDAQMKEYSAAHENSHIFDTEVYPATPTTEFVLTGGAASGPSETAGTTETEQTAEETGAAEG